MLTPYLQSILPGVRSLRGPLISGLLWALLGWWLLADNLPDLRETHAWFDQVSALAGTLGAVGVAVVASVLIFVLGALMMPVSNLLSGLLALPAPQVREYAAWQRKAREQRRYHRQRIKWLQARARAGREARGEDPAELRRKLTDLRKPWALIYPRSRAKTLGRLSASDAPLEELASRIVYGHWVEGIRSIITAASKRPPKEVREKLHDPESHLDRLSAAGADLLSEVREGPLDVMRVLDQRSASSTRETGGTAYLELDRESGELEVRRAIAAPLTAWSITLTVQVSPWFLVALILSLVLSAASSDQGLRLRVLNIIYLLGWQAPMTPTLQRVHVDATHVASDELDGLSNEEAGDQSSRGS